MDGNTILDAKLDSRVKVGQQILAGQCVSQVWHHGYMKREKLCHLHSKSYARTQNNFDYTYFCKTKIIGFSKIIGQGLHTLTVTLLSNLQ